MKRRLKLLISLFFFAGSAIWNRLRRLFGWRRHGTCTVLYYHSVRGPQRERFARQMDALMRWARPIAADSAEPLSPGQHYAAVTFDDGYQNIVQNALPELRRRNIPAALFIPTGRLGKNADWQMESGSADHDEPLMTPEQLRQLPRDLLTIGSHTVSHAHLAALDEAQATRELGESRSALQALLEQPPSLFSFPYGEHNDALVDLCRRAGYKRVFTITPRFALVRPDEYVSGRVAVEPDDGRLEFLMKLMGAYRWMPWASALKRRLQHPFARRVGA